MVSLWLQSVSIHNTEGVAVPKRFMETKWFGHPQCGCMLGRGHLHVRVQLSVKLFKTES